MQSIDHIDAVGGEAFEVCQRIQAGPGDAPFDQ